MRSPIEQGAKTPMELVPMKSHFPEKAGPPF